MKTWCTGFRYRRVSVCVLMAMASGWVEGAGKTRGDFATTNVTPSTSTYIPLGYDTYTGTYQQIYDRSLFSSAGPVAIQAVAFQTTDSPSSQRTIDVTITLSSTDATPDDPGSDYTTNLGPDALTVFSSSDFTYTALANGTFDVSFSLLPFTFDPSQGKNLLVQIEVGTPQTPNTALIPFLFGTSTEVGRLFNTGFNDPPPIATPQPDYGLQTRFTVTAVPEPASLVLSLAGLGVFLSARRLRARS